jgi:tetratricopeptide (TPR) repeat protein
VATCAVFFPVKDHQLLNYDDPGNVVTNPYFNPPTLRNMLQIWRVPYFGTYAPVTYSFFFFEASLARRSPPDATLPPLDPRVFHLGNLVLHVLGVILVFGLLNQLTGCRRASALGAMVFGWHPCQAEVVGWVTETKALLAGAFAVLGLWRYVTFSQTSVGKLARGKARGDWRVTAWLNYAVGTGCFLLALLSKASAVAVPLMALVLDVMWLKLPLRKSAARLAPWFLLAAVLALVTKFQQSDESFQFVTPLWARPVIAGDALAFYLIKVCAPLRLTTDYGRSPQFVLARYWLYFAWLLPAALCGLLVLCRVDRRYWAALALSLAAILPVSGLIPFGYQDISTVADRYLHLALIGVALAVAWFLATHWRGATVAAVLAIILVLAVLSRQQIHVWHDDQTLATHGLAINRHSQLLRHILASELMRQGRAAQGLRLYREAAELYPRSIVAQLKLAESLDRTGKPDKAISHFRRAIAIDPESAEAHRQLAAALDRRGQDEEALRHFQLALKQSPNSRPIHLGLAELYRQHNRWPEAIEHYRAALARQHEDARAWLSLGEALQQIGNRQEAVAAFRQAVRIIPDQPVAWMQLGTGLAQSGDSPGAVDAFRTAVRLDPRMTVAHQNLAAVLAGSGATDEAIVHLRAALKLAPADPNANFSLGVLLARKQEWEPAIAHIRSALAAKPTWIEALSALAETLLSANQPDDALETYQQALRLAPKRADLHRGMGVLLAKHGQKEQAIEHLSTALSLNPADTQARAALRALGVATSDPALPPGDS